MELLYQMVKKIAKSFNAQVYEKAYQRLNLSSTHRIVLQRLLGFLIRNDKSFPYSAVKMSEITGFSLRTIFNTLNDLEKSRLIIREGMGKNRRFKRGAILSKIITTVQNRTKTNLFKYSATVHLVHQKSSNRAAGAYSKTSSYSKHKERGIFSALSKEEEQELLWYLKNPSMTIKDSDKYLFDNEEMIIQLTNKINNDRKKRTPIANLSTID